MPEGDQSKELQDLLKELLASASTEPDVTAGQRPPEEPPNSEDRDQAPAGAVVSVEGGGSLRQPQACDVEIIPPEEGPTGAANRPQAGAGTALHAPAEGGTGAASPVTLEGKLEIHVLPPVPPSTLLLFERALKGRDDVRWLGTWGRSSEGTTVHLLLNSPVLSTRLFKGISFVQQAELARGAKAWEVRVHLASEGAEAAAREEALDEAPARLLGALRAESTESDEPPAPATLGQASPYQPGQQPEPPSVYLEPLEQAQGTVDVEVSPINSLEALNRFERLLSSFSPGCQVVNVLSLDGVSTVLITLEGMNGDLLAQRLQEKIGALKLEAVQGRLVAQLPEKW